MDPRVRRAMERWPDVPALYGWLRLDETGHWWLNGARVRNQALFAFIGRNYAADERGCWYFQNGPQRGYVALDYTPWVLHIDNSGHLRTQTGEHVSLGAQAVIDEQGNLLLETRQGPALLAGEALPVVADNLRDPHGNPLDSDGLERVIDGRTDGASLHWDGQVLPLTLMQRRTIPGHYGFVRTPSPESDPARQ